MMNAAAVADAGVRYVPHARQETFHKDPRPWRWFCAGYGTGKTKALVIEALTLAVVTHPGFQGIVAAPTYPLLFQSWFQTWMETVPRAWWSLKRDPLFGPFIAMANGSKIWLRSSSNPASNEGINAAWLIYDEAPRERDRAALDVLFSRVRTGYPGRQQCVVVAGPPMTRGHWTAVEFGTGSGNGYTGDAWQWANRTTSVVRARTADNPNLPPDYEERLRRRPGATRAWCAQWLDAQFGSIEGQVYDRFTRDVHVIPAAKLAGRAWRRVIAGVDWGYSHYGVMIPVAEDGMGDAYALGDEAHQGLLVEAGKGQWGGIAAGLVRDRHVTEFYCDPSRPDLIRALANALRIEKVSARVYPADNDVGDGIRRVAALLESAADRAVNPGQRAERRRPALYLSDAAAYTIGEAEGYVRKKLRDGSHSEDPEKRNDHAMDALRYAVAQIARAA
jgi:hypothetical protein